MTKKQIKIMTKTFKALSDPTRLAIVEMVCKAKIRTGVKEMTKKLKIESTLLSHHLKILRDEGILRSERIGKKVFYWTGENMGIAPLFKGFYLRSGIGEIRVGFDS